MSVAAGVVAIRATAGYTSIYPDNPYRDFDPDALVTECGRFATELRTRRKRTAAERARMAHDVAHLLLAAAARIRGTRNMPASLEVAGA